MRWAGETALPAPTVLEQGVAFKIPSRDPGRNIPCRLMYPTSRKTDEERKNCAGSVMHLHGGGWVLGDERSTDILLQFYADAGDLAVISVGYRHAPEDPFPKGPEDCFDAADFLAAYSEKQYGGPLRFIGGEVSSNSILNLVRCTLTFSFQQVVGIFVAVFFSKGVGYHPIARVYHAFCTN